MGLQEYKAFWFGEDDVVLSLFILILIITLIDIFTTLFGINKSPSIQELNPIMGFFLSIHPVAFITVNLSLSLGASLVISRFSVERLEEKLVSIPLLTVILIRTIGILNNLYIIMG